jgi:GNAT superfamily N-acetyltransferase
MVESAINTYKIMTGRKLYDYLIDRNSKNPGHKFEEIKNRIKFFSSKDMIGGCFCPEDEINYFFVAFDDDKIVGMIKLKTGGNCSYGYPEYKNWISYCSVDSNYQGQGIARELAEILFKFAKEHNFNILTSGYTEDGFKKLKPMFAKLSLLYDVDFMDDREYPEF